MGEGGVAAVVPHAPSDPSATTFDAARNESGSGGELGGVVHAWPTLCRDGGRQMRVNGGDDRWDEVGTKETRGKVNKRMKLAG